MSVCALLCADCLVRPFSSARPPAVAVRIGGEPLARLGVRTLLGSGAVDRVVVLVDESDVEVTRRLFAAESDRVGVSAGPADVRGAEVVVLHEATRALAPVRLASTVVTGVRESGLVSVPVLPVSDTIKRVDDDGRILGTEDRSMLREVQTPIALPAPVFRALDPMRLFPPAALLSRLDGPVRTVPGDPLAFRIDSEWDLRVAESLIRT